MKDRIAGIHHVTAVAGDPQRNLDFYTQVLGLRMVKLTVNFDDPGTYHFYFADGLGRPGTVLTFFPWVGARRGRRGNGQVALTAFSIPAGGMGYWRERLKRHRVTAGQPARRFDQAVLPFLDPDGLHLELVENAASDVGTPWEAGPVPAAYAIRGFYGVTLWEADLQKTADLLTETLGFHTGPSNGPLHRFIGAPGVPGAVVDILHQPDAPFGVGGAGTVHHVAWRTPDDETQLAWQERVAGTGLQVTPVRDRQYFHSIYFREPGGVLFEIATDPPGFTLDETPEALGQALKLPPWLEPRRAEIEQTLPRLEILPVTSP
jgi:glyoxalase family protein